jgi:hypothetical protein
VPSPPLRLRTTTYREVSTEAMVYDRQPITDPFRAVAPDMVLWVEWCGYLPFVFTLRRYRLPAV